MPARCVGCQATATVERRRLLFAVCKRRFAFRLLRFQTRDYFEPTSAVSCRPITLHDPPPASTIGPAFGDESGGPVPVTLEPIVAPPPPTTTRAALLSPSFNAETTFPDTGGLFSLHHIANELPHDFAMCEPVFSLRVDARDRNNSRAAASAAAAAKNARSARHHLESHCHRRRAKFGVMRKWPNRALFKDVKLRAAQLRRHAAGECELERMYRLLRHEFRHKSESQRRTILRVQKRKFVRIQIRRFVAIRLSTASQIRAFCPKRPPCRLATAS